MKSWAYHEAGHTIVARYLRFSVEYTTLSDEVSAYEATKTVRLKDYFEEEALMLGTLRRKGKETLERSDYKLFYSILLQKLAGYVAVELAGFNSREEAADHFDEDRALAINVLNYLEPEYAQQRFEKMEAIAGRVLRRKWPEVQALAEKLEMEKTVYWDEPEQRQRT